jgi:hypothetical protein
MKKRTALFLLAAFTLLLAACTMQTVTEVKSDGSGTYTIEYGFTQDELDSLAQFGMTEDEMSDPCNMSDMMGSDMPSDITFTQEKRGEETWCTYTKSFKDLDELNAYFASDMEGMTVNRLEIADNTFYYDITPGDTGDTSGLDMLGIAMKFNWVLKVPGTVGANNASKVDGNTLTWDLLSKDLPDHFTAESSLGGGGLFGPLTSSLEGLTSGLGVSVPVLIAVLCGCCLGVVVIIAVIVVVVVTRRKKSSAE